MPTIVSFYQRFPNEAPPLNLSAFDRTGLGWLIMDAWGLADMGRMFTGILGMCVLGLLFYGAIGIAQKLLCPWMR